MPMVILGPLLPEGMLYAPGPGRSPSLFIVGRPFSEIARSERRALVVSYAPGPGVMEGAGAKMGPAVTGRPSMLYAGERGLVAAPLVFA